MKDSKEKRDNKKSIINDNNIVEIEKNDNKSQLNNENYYSIYDDLIDVQEEEHLSFEDEDDANNICYNNETKSHNTTNIKEAIEYNEEEQMIIKDIWLKEKDGGKSGHIVNDY